MNPEIQKQLLQQLDALAAKLGVAANQLFTLYVRQAYIDGFEAIAATIICATISIALWWNGRKLSKQAKIEYEKYLTSKDKSYRYVVLDKTFSQFYVAAVFFAFVTVFFTTCAIDNLSNPSLQAIQHIMDSIR